MEPSNQSPAAYESSDLRKEKNHGMRTWGFRFSVIDGVVIVVGGIAAVWLQREDNPLWWIEATVVVHFFLFCNVFRVRRKYELLWAVLFIVNTGMWLWYRDFSIGKVLACQSIVTVKVISAEVFRPRYHGIFARKINRRLDEYLEGKNL